MTKEILIQIIRDSLVNGNQKAAHDAIDDYKKQECQKYINCLKDILTDWDERLHVEGGFPIEEKKVSDVNGVSYEYWSPAASLVKSELINNARNLYLQSKQYPI